MTFNYRWGEKIHNLIKVTSVNIYVNFFCFNTDKAVTNPNHTLSICLPLFSFLSFSDASCPNHEKFNVEVMETANIGLKVAE